MFFFYDGIIRAHLYPYDNDPEERKKMVSD